MSDILAYIHLNSIYQFRRRPPKPCFIKVGENVYRVQLPAGQENQRPRIMPPSSARASQFRLQGLVPTFCSGLAFYQRGLAFLFRGRFEFLGDFRVFRAFRGSLLFLLLVLRQKRHTIKPLRRVRHPVCRTESRAVCGRNAPHSSPGSRT